MYMADKKLSSYIADANIALQSYHLSFRWFLYKSTLNVKVNNWDVQLSDYNIQFKFIKGVQNTLADTCRLIDFELMEPNLLGKEGYEYEY